MVQIIRLCSGAQGCQICSFCCNLNVFAGIVCVESVTCKVVKEIFAYRSNRFAGRGRVGEEGGEAVFFGFFFSKPTGKFSKLSQFLCLRWLSKKKLLFTHNVAIFFETYFKRRTET